MMRIYSQLNEDYDLFKMAMVYTITMRGIPQIYYGTEILMPSTDDHGIIRSDFPGGWRGDDVNAFTGKGLTEQQKEAQEFTKKLLKWRSKASAVQTGGLTHFEPREKVYVYFRYDDDQKIMVILNKNTEGYLLDLERFSEMTSGVSRGVDVLSGRTFDMSQKINLPVKSALILELK
jgi:glycosidase